MFHFPEELSMLIDCPSQKKNPLGPQFQADPEKENTQTQQGFANAINLNNEVVEKDLAGILEISAVHTNHLTQKITTELIGRCSPMQHVTN